MFTYGTPLWQLKNPDSDTDTELDLYPDNAKLSSKCASIVAGNEFLKKIEQLEKEIKYLKKFKKCSERFISSEHSCYPSSRDGIKLSDSDIRMLTDLRMHNIAELYKTIDNL